VRALGHRVMYGISRVSTVTPHALLASALLAHRRRGISERDLTDRIVFLRSMVTELGSPLSRQLKDAPSSPVVLGPIRDAMKMFAQGEMVSSAEAGGEVIFQVSDDHRPELSFYKNTLLNLIAGRAIVCAALLADEQAASHDAIRERALFLSRLFKLEFLYPVGKAFEEIFDETVAHLTRCGLVHPEGEAIVISPEAHARPMVAFLADLLRDLLESYSLTTRQAQALDATGVDKKEFLQRALEAGRAEFLAGTLTASEALSKTTLENAVQFLVDQKYVNDKDKKLTPGSASLIDLAQQIRRFVPET
jgi:glycerol-3-phosphate O-acyltransferase